MYYNRLVVPEQIGLFPQVSPACNYLQAPHRGAPQVCFPVAGVECPIAVADCEDFKVLDLDERRKKIAHAALQEQGARKRPRVKGDGIDLAIDVDELDSAELEKQKKRLQEALQSLEKAEANLKIKSEAASTSVFTVPLRFC